MRNKIKCFIILAYFLITNLYAEDIPIFIFAGQSIAINSGTDSGLLSSEMSLEQTNVLLYNAKSTTLYGNPNLDVHWTAYKPPTGPGFNGGDSIYPNPKGSFGPEITTANYISKNFYNSNTVGIFKYAVGNSSLHYHYNSTLPGPFYTEMITFIKNALNLLSLEKGYNGKIAGIFWTQGESDAVDSIEFSKAYGSNLFNFVTSLREEFKDPKLPFIYGRITPAWINSEYVRHGQSNLTNQLKDVYMVNADDLITSTLHYNNEGTIELGNRYGLAYGQIINQNCLLEIKRPLKPKYSGEFTILQDGKEVYKFNQTKPYDTFYFKCGYQRINNNYQYRIYVSCKSNTFINPFGYEWIGSECKNITIIADPKQNY